MKINYGDKHMYEKVDVRQTVGDFKKKLEKFVGQPSSRFKLFYIDTEANKLMLHFGTEELKLPNRRLHSLNVREGDEFEIDLKPMHAPVIHSASEHQFQHANPANNNLNNLHFHHYNSHLNNNSHHLFSANNSSFSPSSQATRPVPIGANTPNKGGKHSTVANTSSDLLSNKQRTTSLSKQKPRPTGRLGAKIATSPGQSEEVKGKESPSSSAEFSSMSLPANLSSLDDYKRSETLEDATAMDTSVEFTLGNEEVAVDK